MPDDQQFRVEDLEVSTVRLPDLCMGLDQEFVSIESNGVVAVMIPNKGPSAVRLAQKILEFLKSSRVKFKGPEYEGLDGCAPRAVRLHKLGCDEYHAHHAPECCRRDCWCLKNQRVGHNAVIQQQADLDPHGPYCPAQEEDMRYPIFYCGLLRNHEGNHEYTRAF